MNIKRLLLILHLILIAKSQLMKSTNQTMYFGSSNNWQNYEANSRGIFIDIDYSSLSLTSTPFVETTLRCITVCHQ